MPRATTLRGMAARKLCLPVLLTLVASLLWPASPAAASGDPPRCDATAWAMRSQPGYIWIPIRAPSEFYCSLQRGDYNSFAVLALQNMLVKCYGQDIALDADFGPDTETALDRAQTWERYVNGKTIPVGGVYDGGYFSLYRWPFYERRGDFNSKWKCMY